MTKIREKLECPDCKKAHGPTWHIHVENRDTTTFGTHDRTCEKCGLSTRVLISMKAPTTLHTPGEKEATVKGAGKPRLTLLDSNFLAALALHMEKGIKDGRTADDWRDLEWTDEKRRAYCDALLRHVHLDFDPIAVAANCMMIWVNDGGMS